MSPFYTICLTHINIGFAMTPVCHLKQCLQAILATRFETKVRGRFVVTAPVTDATLNLTVASRGYLSLEWDASDPDSCFIFITIPEHPEQVSWGEAPGTYDISLSEFMGDVAPTQWLFQDNP